MVASRESREHPEAGGPGPGALMLPLLRSQATWAVFMAAYVNGHLENIKRVAANVPRKDR